MPKKREFTQEMIDDLYKIGDKEFRRKWNLSLPAIIRFRRKNGIPSFTPQHGTKRKNVDGIEYKWCPRDGGHWGLLSEFKLSPTRAGGYRGVCHIHEKIDRVGNYHKHNGKEKAQEWRKTDNGKKSLRRTWRISKAIKENAYVKWDKEDEETAYEVFGHACAYCGELVDFLKIEFDHFIPIALGGKTEPKNMIPCCKKCNHGKGGKFKREPLEWLTSKYGKERAYWIYNNIKEKLGE